VDVVDADPQAGLREGEGQGQADVATAAHDAEVEMGVRVRLQVGAESNVPEVAAARGFRSSYPGTRPSTRARCPGPSGPAENELVSPPRFVNLGCRTNAAETDEVAALLKDATDVVVVNSCTVT